jgi:hypothetical protein
MNRKPTLAATVIRRSGTMLLILIASFALGELVLRVVQRSSPSFIYYDATYNRFRGQPGSDFHGHPLNRLGFNDGPWEEYKGDRYRIAALGDSIAFGVVPYRENYLTLLEQDLQTLRPQCEVLNMGIPRTGPIEQLSLLLGEALRYDPDFVLVSFFTGNDFLDVQRATHKQKSLVDRSYVLSLLRFALMLRPVAEPAQVYGRRAYDDDRPTFAEEAFMKIVAKRAVVFRTDWPPFTQVFERTVEALDDIRRVCARRDIDLVIVLIPEEVQVDRVLQHELIATRTQYRADNTDFTRPNRLLADRLTELGIDVLDLYPPFAEQSIHERLYRPRDTHWNIAGNRLAAKEIGRHLAETRFERTRFTGGAEQGRR